MIFDEQVFQVIIIGGGVVGCSVLRKLTLSGVKKCILLEKMSDFIGGASSGNSGILHCGFDVKDPYSKESLCIRHGYDEFQSLFGLIDCQLPINRCGAIVVAWDEEEFEMLDHLEKNARRNGIHDCVVLDAKQTVDLEPSLKWKRDSIIGSLWVPKETVVDPWFFSLCYLLHAIKRGACARSNWNITQGEYHPGESGKRPFWELQTDDGRKVKGFVVINCAGNYGDLVEKISGRNPNFTIYPRAGTFLLFDLRKETDKKGEEKRTRSGAGLSRIILPIPQEHTKGILLAPTFRDSFVLCGPTATSVEQRDSTRLRPSSKTLSQLNQIALSRLPHLLGGCNEKSRGSYIGIRPATEHSDYQIRAHPEKAWMTVGGIRSTGFSAALGIAQAVTNLYHQSICQWTPPKGDATREVQEMKQIAIELNSKLEGWSNSTSVSMINQLFKITHPLSRFCRSAPFSPHSKL